MLAYYVEWHMRKALAPLLIDDEQLSDDKKKRNAVLRPEPSIQARKKKARRRTADNLLIQSFKTLLAELGTRMRNRCRISNENNKSNIIINQLTELSALQNKAFELLEIRTQ